MSAWICSDNHINLLATFALRRGVVLQYQGETIDCAKEPQRVATVLLDENFRSVNYRYDEHEHEAITFREVKKLPGVLAVLKQLLCYDYQACECTDYDHTLAKAIVQACLDEVRAMRPTQTLEQMRETSNYRKAPWGID